MPTNRTELLGGIHKTWLEQQREKYRGHLPPADPVRGTQPKRYENESIPVRKMREREGSSNSMLHREAWEEGLVCLRPGLGRTTVFT